MAEPSTNATQAIPPALLTLLDFGRRARNATSTDELEFMLVNGTHALTPYRQAVLWWEGSGVQALSGVVQPDQNAPYVDWLKRFFESAPKGESFPARIEMEALAEDQRSTWSDWLPAQAVLVPLPGRPPGALLLARDLGWTDNELALLQEWTQTWLHAWHARTTPKIHRPWRAWKTWLDLKNSQKTWHQRRISWLVGALLLALFMPVRTTVLAPGEVVPAQPVVIRAPVEGVIARFSVQPNDVVTKGQALFEFEPTLIETRVQVAQQALETALAQYRQTSQLALTDPKYKVELAAQAGSIEEKRSEFEYLKEQKRRAIVKAPDEGTVLFDDPSSWIGKPVAIGERILRIAKTGDVEVEVWLPVADAIELRQGDPVMLYLQADPLHPVSASLHYFSHEAQQRPDGTYAYRLRATLQSGTVPRVGLKGTAKTSGRWTVLSYWILRRPLAVIRTTLGI